jgi:hypothetical protein
MQMVTFEDCKIVNGSTLTFKAGEKVVLTNGTKISSGNNVTITYGEYECEGSKNKSKSSSKPTSVSKSKIANRLEFYPNPNNGSFFIKANSSFEAKDIHIFGILGKELYFDFNNNTIKILDNYRGMALVYLLYENEIIVKKIMIYE